jgi:quinol monooxygenase YgiN
MSTIEIARFNVKDGAEARLLDAWPAMVDAMRRAHPALRSVALVRFDDGTWADIAVWDDRDSVDAACSAGAQLPEVQAFFDQIAEDVSLDLGEVARRID